MPFAIYVKKGAAPRIGRSFLLRAKNAVLGRSYDLSVAFVDDAAMGRANRVYRGRRVATDILSFPLSRSSGEILLSMAEIRKRAKVFGRGASNFLSFLFIHGLLHLKGYSHGSKMEREEEKIRRKFEI